MQWTPASAVASFGIAPLGDLEGIGVRLDDGVEEGIETADPPQVGLRQPDTCQGARVDQRADLRDRGLEPWLALVGVALWDQPLIDDGILPSGREPRDKERPGPTDDPGRDHAGSGGSLWTRTERMSGQPPRWLRKQSLQ